MKVNLTKPFDRVATVSSLVLLLALTGCGGGGGSDDPELAAKGPPSNSNSPNAGEFGASIGVSNTCELVDDEYDDDNNLIKPVLRVTTTIDDKSSGDISPDFTENGTTVRAKEKGKGNDTYDSVGKAAIFTGSLGDTVTDIQLCVGDDLNGYSYPVEDTVSLNASVTVSVDNDNKGEYVNRCSDDPATDGIDEGKVVVSAAELDLLCSL
jgi:hypothetical protein